MEVSPALVPLIGLLLALWTGGAGWVILRASSRAAQSEGSRKTARRLARMIEDAPAIPLLVRADGRIAFAPGSAQAAEQAAALQAEGVVVINGRVARAWRPAPALDAWLWQPPDQPPV